MAATKTKGRSSPARNRPSETLEGVGPVLAAVFCVEIGDVCRFSGPQALCSWSGLTPKHRESDGKAHRGRTTKQGSRLVRLRKATLD
jgi:transposase